jgi:TonB family protein
MVPTPSAPQAAASTNSPVNEPARVVTQGPLVFPMRAVQMGKANVEQVVKLKVFVGEQGQPLKVSVVEGVSGSLGFDEAAIEAANKSTYTPATRDGKAVRGWTAEISYRFQKRR